MVISFKGSSLFDPRLSDALHVHGFTQVSMTVVVFAVAEQKNEVPGNFVVVD